MKRSTIHNNKFLITVLLLLGSLSLSAKEPSAELLDSIKTKSVDREHAARFGSLAVQTEEGRIIPINTLAIELVQDMSNTSQIAELTPDQFLLSILAFPTLWAEYPFIVVSDEAFAERFNLKIGKCAFVDFFDDYGNYYLKEEYFRLQEVAPDKRTSEDNVLLEMDRKVNMLSELLFYPVLKLFPKKEDKQQRWFPAKHDTSTFTVREALFVGHIFSWYLEEVQKATSNGDWEKADERLTEIASFQVANSEPSQFSRKKIMAEIRYNQLEVYHWSCIGLLVGGTLLLLLSLLNRYSRGNHSRTMLQKMFGFVIIVSFLYLTIGVVFSLYVTGFSPSNSSLLGYTAWLIVGSGVTLAHRHTLVLPVATLLAGILLTQTGLGLL